MGLVTLRRAWVVQTKPPATTTVVQALRVTATTPRRTSTAKATACWRIAAPSSWKAAPMRVRATLTRFANTRKTGSCEFDSCAGCVYPTAENYDPSATRDDGSCVFEGCTDGEFASYLRPSGQCHERRLVLKRSCKCRLQRRRHGSSRGLDAILASLRFGRAVMGRSDWVGSACDVDPLTEEELLAAGVEPTKARDHGTLHAACLDAATPAH